MNRYIEMIEVGPRDGFQNVGKFIKTEDKKRVIDSLYEAGVRKMQHTSFISPKAIPQMKDAAELTYYCMNKYPDLELLPLVPNFKGAEIAYKLGIRKISYVVSLSEEHNKRNINRTHIESLEELKRIIESFQDLNIILDLSTTFGCPFMNRDLPDIIEFLNNFIAIGIKEVNLCDTIGIATPADVRNVIKKIKVAYPDLKLHIHIHDTRNMGMVNTLVAIEEGISTIQSSLGGLGGCPFAPGASGNLATEDVINMLNNMGYQTKIDSIKIISAAKNQYRIIAEGNFSGHLQFI